MTAPRNAWEDFNLYGQHVLIEFVKRLRPMVAYTGVEALIEQINDDVAKTREVLAEDAKTYCPPERSVRGEKDSEKKSEAESLEA